MYCDDDKGPFELKTILPSSNVIVPLLPNSHILALSKENGISECIVILALPINCFKFKKLKYIPCVSVYCVTKLLISYFNI